MQFFLHNLYVPFNSDRLYDTVGIRANKIVSYSGIIFLGQQGTITISDGTRLVLTMFICLLTFVINS